MADWVIVVDDDVMNLKLAGNILSKAHMRVTAIKSGDALLDYLRDKIAEQEIPDLILLDIKMPGRDGFETMSALQDMDGGKEIPVIFLSGDEEKMSAAKGLALGAVDFIKKPFVPELLVLRVRHMIDLDRFQKGKAV